MTPPAAPGGTDLVLVGRITGCFGIRGYLKLELAGDSPERAERLGAVYVGPDAGSADRFEIADVIAGERRVLVQFRGVEDRTSAERFRGMLLFVGQADAAPPPRGGYYIHDLIGCRVLLDDGTPVGVLEDVLDAAGRHLWSVRTPAGLRLIPAVKEFIVSVDTPGRVVVVRLPDGLLSV